MKGLVLGAAMALFPTAAGDKNTQDVTKTPDLLLPSGVVGDVKTRTDDCIYALDDDPQKITDIGLSESTLVENKVTLKKCIADAQEILKGLGDSEIKSYLNETLYVANKVLGDMDAYDPQALEQRIQFLEEKLFQHKKESYYTMLAIILSLGILIFVLWLHNEDAKMGRYQEIKKVVKDIINSKNDEELSEGGREILELLKEFF